MLNNEDFDLWAKDYDKNIDNSSNKYPFDGYYDVLNKIYNLINHNIQGNILDVGIGTGTLSKKLYNKGFKITGLDFSKEMIKISKEKMPNGIFIKSDFSKDLPLEIKNNKFDYIISSYAMHHLNALEKLQLIIKLKELLNPNGKILIADVAFKTKEDLINCKNNNLNSWDNDEFYICANNILNKLRENNINANYTQISSCAGILEII